MALVSISVASQTRIGDCIANAGLAAAFNGTTAQTAAGSAAKNLVLATDVCFCGTQLAAAKRIGQVIVYGSNDQGFCAVSNPSVTLWVYGKAGSDPANSTDGTLLATLTFTDTANESAGRTLAVTDTSLYDRVWVRGLHNTAGRNFLFAEILLWEETGAGAATGNLAATEAATPDSSSFTSVALAAGALAATEAATPDTSSFTAAALASSSLAATEAGADTAALTATLPASAGLAATEAGVDAASFTATLGPALPAGAVADLAAAEATTPDVAAFTAILGPPLLSPAIANLAAVETGSDTAAFSARLPPPPVSPSPPAPVWPSTGVAPAVPTPRAAPAVRIAQSAPAVAAPASAPAVQINWPSSQCCPEYFPPSARNPLPYPQPTQTDAGGYLSPAFTAGFDVATPPWPTSFRSRIAAMPPLPAPPLPGYCRAGDPCQPQRTDSEEYRRAVFLGLITPDGSPAVDGVSVAAEEQRREADRENAETIHSPDYTQIHQDSLDYDHGYPGLGSFSQEFG